MAARHSQTSLTIDTGDLDAGPPTAPPVTPRSLRLQIRRELSEHLYYEAPPQIGAIAIYTLSDPRDLTEIRYVGQSAAPERRYAQHVNNACPWLGDDTPWWIKAPKLRPLHEWVRQLHRDERRLPVMVVRQWCQDTEEARVAERTRIAEGLKGGIPLLNFEAELRVRQQSRSATKTRRKRARPAT
jgi:hypothetical protein